MTSEFLTLVVLHFACADLAESRVLNAGERVRCSVIYQKIKIAFMPELDLTAYRALPAEAQASANNDAFLRFLAWRDAHPDLVAHLERVARGEATLGPAL